MEGLRDLRYLSLDVNRCEIIMIIQTIFCFLAEVFQVKSYKQHDGFTDYINKVGKRGLGHHFEANLFKHNNGYKKFLI